jgi:hypothetical protein
VDHDADISTRCYEVRREGKPLIMIWNGKKYLPRPMKESDTCRLGGKFAVKIGEQEVMDLGLDQTRQTSGPWLPGTLPPRWTRVAKYRRREVLKVLNGDGAVCLETDYLGKVMLAVYPPGVKVPRFRYKRALKWKRDGGTGWDMQAIDTTPNSIAEVPSDIGPRRIVWWIREGEGLVRVRKAPLAGVRAAATVYHFSPASDVIVRVEIVEPYTAEEWLAILESKRPQTFLEQLDIMRRQILTFKDAPETLKDPEDSSDFVSWRMNPVWHYFNSAGLALDNLKAAMAYKDDGETCESVQNRIEFIARQALALGENFAKLGLTPLVPAVRRGKQMDRKGKQGPKKRVPLWEAVHTFAAQHPGKSSEVLRKLKIAVRNHSVDLRISQEGFWYHLNDPGTECREITVLKEVRKALGAQRAKERSKDGFS